MPVIASKSYKPGEVIFECSPVVHCVESDFKSKCCDNCLKKSNSLKKCSKCLQMYYCDKECQQSDWKYHKNECKVYRQVVFRMTESSAFLRLFLRLWVCLKKDQKFAEKRYETVDGRDVSLEEIKVTPKQKLNEEYISFVAKAFRSFKLNFEFKELRKWYYVLNFLMVPLYEYCDNTSEIVLNSFYKINGFGVFIQMQDLSHSCLPNSNFLKTGLKAQFRAMNSIESGEEITSAVIDLAQNKNRRHKDLIQMGISVCQCDRCRLNLDEDIDYEEFEELQRIHTKIWIHMGLEEESFKYCNNYQIDGNLITYLTAIYGENSVYVTKALVLSYITFVLYSIHSSKSLAKLWYKRIEPKVLISHGSGHRLYKMLRKAYKMSV